MAKGTSEAKDTASQDSEAPAKPENVKPSEGDLVPRPKQEPEAPSKYPIDLHMAESQGMYGQPSHIVAAAVALLREEGNEDTEIDAATMQDAVKRVLVRPVASDSAAAQETNA